MSSRVVPILVGAALAVACGSAFAFDAQVTRPTPLRTHPSHRAAVIEVVPANAVIDMARCARGWCAAEYAGRLGFVYTPVLVSTEPVPAEAGPEQLLIAPAAAVGGVVGVATAPITAIH